MNAQVPAQGRLLVATPGMGDPNFEECVLLLLAHGEEGSLGVVLNRPTDTVVDRLLPQWSGPAAAPAVVFQGGPVGLDSALCLARPRTPAHPAIDALTGGVGVLDLNADPDVTVPALAELRVFLGYAGWGAGQLEAEIEAGAWWVVDGRPEDPLATDPSGLWQAVLRRQRGLLAAFANAPADLSLN